MKTNIERLREAVIAGGDSMKNHDVKRMILEDELNFIERRGMEENFLVAQELTNELKGCEGIHLGPGQGWMVSSHVCRALGLTNLSPNGLGPDVTWGDDECTPTITIEVDDASCDFVKMKVDEYMQKNGYRFDVFCPLELSMIKRILALIEKYGKEIPQLYDKDKWHEDYELFYSGDLDCIPRFGYTIIQR